MRWQWVWVWLLAPVAALALDLRPAEAPPEGFQAGQYIDSRGCVFLRDDAGRWTPRLARDHTPLCGYPPSVSLRGLDGKPRLRALDPDAGKTRTERASEALARVMANGLHQGELASDPRPLQVLPDLGPEPHSTQPLDDLKAALRAAPAVRQGMSRDLQPNRRLCALLGYDGQAKAGRVGQDPTKGYCAALPASDLSRLAFARPVGSGRDAATGTPMPGAAMLDVTSVRPSARLAGSGKTGIPALSGPRATGKEQSKPAAGTAVGMIPAGARYVQIGSYADAAQADRAARRAAGLGYPLLRAKNRGMPGVAALILAGPFDSREGIVRALDRLRRAGFRDAFPR